VLSSAFAISDLWYRRDNVEKEGNIFWLCWEGRSEGKCFVGLFNKTQANARLQSLTVCILFFKPLEREEEKVGGRGGSERDCVLGGGTEKFPAFKIPRQCPLVLLIEVHLIKM
jgi:hypothetical protein